MVKIVQDFIPKGKRNRPGYKLKLNYITIHDTANTGKGADAKAHSNYLKSTAAANIPASWHFTVDSKQIYQHLPLNENGWHAGDGTNGKGNRESVGIEICENSDGDRKQAEKNAAELTAKLLKENKLPISRVKQHYHWSGKNCPRVLRKRKGGWEGFLADVERALNSAKTVYRVICGSFLTWEEADAQVARLKKAGFSTFFMGFKHDGKHYIRVVCGEFSKRADADKRTAELKKKGFDSFIVAFSGKEDPLPARPEPEIKETDIFRVIINKEQVIALTGYEKAKNYALTYYPHEEITLQNVRTGKSYKIQDKKLPETPKPPEAPVTDGTPIYGDPEVALEQAKQWAMGRGAHQRFVDIADTYWIYGNITGIRADALYCQAAHETNFGRYTGAVKPEQNNWAGIKIVNPKGDNAEDHETFSTPENGVRAHFNHMAAYIGIPPVGNPHERYFIVLQQPWAGKVKFVEELGGKWAPSKTYGEKILQYLGEAKNTEIIEKEPEEGRGETVNLLKKILLILEEIFSIIKMLLYK